MHLKTSKKIVIKIGSSLLIDKSKKIRLKWLTEFSKDIKELLKKNTHLFSEVEKKFKVEKEVLLALWGIETHFGKHVGKMDIISSLATLSYDKRRRNFFSSQLFILLKFEFCFNIEFIELTDCSEISTILSQDSHIKWTF